MLKQYDNGSNLVVYLNGRRADIDDLVSFVDDYKTFGKEIVTHKFKAGRFVFLETRI